MQGSSGHGVYRGESYFHGCTSDTLEGYTGRVRLPTLLPDREMLSDTLEQGRYALPDREIPSEAASPSLASPTQVSTPHGEPIGVC